MSLFAIAVVEQIVFAVPLLVGILLVGLKVRGPARRLGLIGCAIMLACRILGCIWSWVLVPQIGKEQGYATILTWGPGSIIGLISAAGLMLVIIAVAIGRSPAAAPLQPAPFTRPPSPR